MKNIVLAVLFSGLLFPALLVLFHLFNPVRTFFPGARLLDLGGFYLTGFAAGTLAALFMVKIKNLKMPQKN